MRPRRSIVLACLAALVFAAASAAAATGPKPKPATAKPGARCDRKGQKVRDLVCTARAGKLIWVATPMRPSGPGQGAGGSTSRQPCAGAKPPLLKTIGVELGPYDAATGSAGAFRFTREPLQEGRVFMDFGYSIQQAERPKRNPQPTFVLPLGTPVVSLIDGVVWRISDLWSTPTLGDVSVMVAEKEGAQPCFTLELEHVINPRVKVGERVRAGQAVAEVGPLSKDGNAGMGLVEIGILTGGPDGRPHHLCPFAYLDPSVRAQIHEQLRSLTSAWEAYRGDPSLYDEAAWVGGDPGCLAEDLTDE